MPIAHFLKTSFRLVARPFRFMGKKLEFLRDDTMSTGLSAKHHERLAHLDRKEVDNLAVTNL